MVLLSATVAGVTRCDTAITYLCALAEKVAGFRLWCASCLHPHIGLLACSNEEKTFVNKVDRKKPGVVSHMSDMGHIYPPASLLLPSK